MRGADYMEPPSERPVDHKAALKAAQLDHDIAEKKSRLQRKADRRARRRCFWTRPRGHNWVGSAPSEASDFHCANCPATKTVSVDYGW